jgi:hypothetical protein
MLQKLSAGLLIRYFILGVLIILGLIMIAEANYRGLFMVTQAFFFSLVPTFLRKFYGIRTPHILQAGVAIFMFATIFLGETAGFYDRFHWWDLIWHTLSGIAFGLIGYAILILTYQKRNVKLVPLFTSLFAMSFSIATSTLWEIIEFLVDIIFKANMQPSGEDTMTDLVVGTLGALIAAYSGYRYVLYRERRGMMNVIIDEAVKKNSTAVIV